MTTEYCKRGGPPRYRHTKLLLGAQRALLLLETSSATEA